MCRYRVKESFDIDWSHIVGSLFHLLPGDTISITNLTLDYCTYQITPEGFAFTMPQKSFDQILPYLEKISEDEVFQNGGKDDHTGMVQGYEGKWRWF